MCPPTASRGTVMRYGFCLAIAVATLPHRTVAPASRGAPVALTGGARVFPACGGRASLAAIPVPTIAPRADHHAPSAPGAVEHSLARVDSRLRRRRLASRGISGDTRRWSRRLDVDDHEKPGVSVQHLIRASCLYRWPPRCIPPPPSARRIAAQTANTGRFAAGNQTHSTHVDREPDSARMA